MQIHRQNAVGTCAGQEIGNEFGGDRNTSFVFAVLAGIAEIGDHGGDPAGTGALEALDHDQELHEVVIDRAAGRLDEEYIASADVFFDAAETFTVGETLHRDLPRGNAQVVADFLVQRNIGRPGKDLQFITHGSHHVFAKW